MTAPLDPRSDRKDWSDSAGSDRIRHLLHTKFKGDRGHMAQAVALPRSVIAACDRGELEPSPDQLRQIASRLATGYNPVWIKSGQGHPRQPSGVATIPMAAGKPRETKPARCPIAERIHRLLMERWHGDVEAMARACGIHGGLAAMLAEGREMPDDDALEKIAAADPTISLDWLLTGEGEPYAIPEPAADAPAIPAAPIAETTAQAIPQPSSLDGLIELIERVKGFGGEVAGLRREVEAARAGQFDRDALRGELDDLHKQLNGMPARFGAAVTHQIEPFRGEIAALNQRIEGLQRFLNEHRPEAAETAVKRLAERVDAIEAQPEPVEWPEDLGTRLERLEDLADTLAGAMRQLDDAGRGILPDLLGRLGVIEATVANLAGAMNRKPSSIPATKHEANLPPDAWMAVGDWSELEGPHQRLIRDDNDRRTMGKRMTRAYRAGNVQDERHEAVARHAKYRVGDMRLYAQWLSSAGLVPDPDAWVEFWLQRRAAF